MEAAARLVSISTKYPVPMAVPPEPFHVGIYPFVELPGPVTVPVPSRPPSTIFPLASAFIKWLFVRDPDTEAAFVVFPLHVIELASIAAISFIISCFCPQVSEFIT
jgi:hypothetical protein